MARVCRAGSAQEVGRASMWMGCKRGGILSVGMEPEVIVKRVWVSYKDNLARVRERLRLEGRRTLEMLQNFGSICFFD